MTDLLSLGLDLGMGSCKLSGADGGLWLQSQVATDGGRGIAPMLGLRNRKPPARIRFSDMALFVAHTPMILAARLKTWISTA